MTNDAGSTESTTGGQKYDTLPTAVPSLRDELCQLINDDTCKSCEFWDRQGYYCFILTMHEDTKKCILVDKIFALLSQHGVRIVRGSTSELDVCGKCPRAVCDGFADYICVRPLVEEKP